MATGVVELVGTQIGSTGSSGHEITKLIDGDFATWFETVGADGAWAGLDAGVAVTVVSYKFCPQFGGEDKIVGAKLQASSAADFLSDVTDLDTIPDADYEGNKFTVRTVASPISKRHIRLLMPDGSHGSLAGLGFFANAGPPSAKPVKPVIAPWGGNYPDGPPPVTSTSQTTSASQYYTLDGSTPDNSDQPYTGSYPPPSGETTTLNVIAYEAGLDHPYSDVSTAIFHNYGFGQNQPTYHIDTGDRVTIGTPSVLCGPGNVPLKIDGYYLRVGANNNLVDQGSGLNGIWQDKSADFYNWEGWHQILRSPADGVFTIRPFWFYNVLNHNYVLHCHLYNTLKAGIATSSVAESGWAWISTTDDPAGVGFKDCGGFVDLDETAYELFTNGGQTQIIISRLDDDYLYAVESNATGMATESPLMGVDAPGQYFNIRSGGSNFYDYTSTYEQKISLLDSPLSDPSSTHDLFTVDPTGTDYNGQPCCLILWGGEFIVIGDVWTGGGGGEDGSLRHSALTFNRILRPITTSSVVVLSPTFNLDAATGVTVGQLVVTESVTGTAEGDVTVATATISVTPTSGRTDQTPRTLTVVGVNTVFTQDDPETIFSVDYGSLDFDSLNVIDDENAEIDLLGGGFQIITIAYVTGATDTYGQAAATAYYVTPAGSISGRLDVAKNLVARGNGTTTAVVTGATDKDGDYSGTVQLAGTTQVPFTYTPNEIGVHTLSFTEPGSLTDAANITLTVTVGGSDNGHSMKTRLRPA